MGLCAKDIDTSDQPWTVRLTEHKTAHHGKDREFWFNDEAQAILSPFMLGRPISAPLFSPAEAEAERRAAMRERRTSHPSANKSRDAKRRKRPANTLGDAYTVDSYRRAIQRGCAKAFPYPPKLRGKRGEKLTPEQKAERGAARQEWRRTHYWHPHQLRHNFLTELRRAAGIDVAQTAAGHSTLDTTAIYAERDRAKARAAVASLKIG